MGERTSVERLRLSVGNFRQICSGGIPAVPRNRNSRNSIPNRSTEEKNARNSVPWKKNRSNFSKFRVEPFRGTKNSRNSVPNRSAEEKNAWNSVPWKKNRNKLSEFRSEACLGQKQAKLSILFAAAGFFCKTSFFHAIFFRSEPRNGLFRKLRNASELALSSAE